MKTKAAPFLERPRKQDSVARLYRIAPRGYARMELHIATVGDSPKRIQRSRRRSVDGLATLGSQTSVPDSNGLLRVIQPISPTALKYSITGKAGQQ